jgi:hypothetical protein
VGTSPAVLSTYLERYPNGEFAAIARTLAEHYDRKLKAEQAAQEEERKRIEEGGRRQRSSTSKKSDGRAKSPLPTNANAPRRARAARRRGV